MATVDPNPSPVPPSAVLDDAHVGDIQGALGTIRVGDIGHAADLAPTSADAARHHGAGSDRHGRRQRRRRRLDLRAGRSGLRLLAAVDAAAAHSRADRQPGDGGAPGRGHRRRARPPDLRALRPLLELLLGRRPLRPELPDDRHRVHRHQPGRRLFRDQPARGRAAGGVAADRHHHQRQLPALGARHVRVPGAEHPGHPARHPESARRRRDRSMVRSCRASPAA